MLNAHPDRWSSGSAKAAETLASTLDYILEYHQPVLLRAIDLAEHVSRESTQRSTMVVMTGSPLVEVPRHGSHQMVPFPIGANPMVREKLKRRRLVPA